MRGALRQLHVRRARARRAVHAPVMRAQLGAHDEQLAVDNLHLAHVLLERLVAVATGQVDLHVDEAVPPPAAARLLEAVLAAHEARGLTVRLAEALHQLVQHGVRVRHRVGREHPAHLRSTSR